MNDSAGLFGPPAAAEAAAPATRPTRQSEARRTKLYPHDTVAAQYLNPYGDNCFDKVPEDALWKGIAKGSFRAEFHSELAAPDADDWRLAVGMSRHSEAIAIAIEKLESEDIGKLLKPDIMTKVRGEIKILKPALATLNFGKGSEGGGQVSLTALKKMKAGEQKAHDEGSVKSAAKEVHKWLMKEQSPLRAVLSLLAGNGCFWAGYAAENTMRSAVKQKPIAEERFIDIVAKRAKTSSSASGSGAPKSDSSGLFNA